MANTGKVLIRSNTAVDLEEILEGMANLDTADIEQFMQQVGKLVAQRKTSQSLSERESELLMAINQSIPLDAQQRFEVLSAKSQEKSLTAAEHAELLDLIALLEQKQGDRLKNLLELAQLRGVSLDKLTQELQLSVHA